jgi:hypothetical protein
VVTVLGLGAPELRLRIIGAFYETFREQFDSAKWLRKYPADHGAQSE